MLQDLGQKQCLSTATLEAYIENRLSSEDQAELKSHLAECRMCDDAVEGIRLASLKEFRRAHDSVRERLRAPVEAVTPDR